MRGESGVEGGWVSREMGGVGVRRRRDESERKE